MKTATIAKPAAAKQSNRVNKTKALAAIRFALEQGVARPQAGSMLKAHTAAFLVLSGMYQGKAASTAQARTILGDTAVGYHLKKENFAMTADGLTLTEKGEMFFAIRGAEMEAVEGYMDVLTTGNTNAKGIQKIGHPSFVRQVA